MYDQDTLNTIAILSFLVGIANYNENLTQNDKAEIMQSLDKQTAEILENVQKALNEQNELLKEILNRLENN